MKRWQKWTLWISGIVVLLLVAALSLAPGFIHRYIEKHDLELVGREISMEDLKINWFNAQIEVVEFDMREQDTSKSFIFIERLFLDLHLLSLPRRFIHVKSLAIESPRFHIEQHGTAFNFDDLLESDSTQSASADTSKAQPLGTSHWRITGFHKGPSTIKTTYSPNSGSIASIFISLLPATPRAVLDHM